MGVLFWSIRYIKQLNIYLRARYYSVHQGQPTEAVESNKLQLQGVQIMKRIEKDNLQAFSVKTPFASSLDGNFQNFVIFKSKVSYLRRIITYITQ